MTLPYLSDRGSLQDATSLIAEYGEHAGYEAAARANKYRDLGNYVNFCRWRQIERMIILLSIDEWCGTVH